MATGASTGSGWLAPNLDSMGDVGDVGDTSGVVCGTVGLHGGVSLVLGGVTSAGCAGGANGTGGAGEEGSGMKRISGSAANSIKSRASGEPGYAAHGWEGALRHTRAHAGKAPPLSWAAARRRAGSSSVVQKLAVWSREVRPTCDGRSGAGEEASGKRKVSIR